MVVPRKEIKVREEGKKERGVGEKKKERSW